MIRQFIYLPAYRWMIIVFYWAGRNDADEILQTLQRFGYLEVLLQLCRRKLIGNYKIDMQPIRLTHKSLLPERPFGRTDALYIGLMRL